MESAVENVQPIAEVMAEDEFRASHNNTGNHVARVGKVWEPVAAEQQKIVDGKGYRYLDYSSWENYWIGEFAANTGWSPRTVRGWMSARRIKAETEIPEGGFAPNSWRQWTALTSLSIEERSEFLLRYEVEIKPRLRESGVSARLFDAAVAEFKREKNGEEEATTRATLSEEDFKDIPSGERTASEKFAFQIYPEYYRLSRIDAEEVVEAALRAKPPKQVRRDIEAARKLADIYAELGDQLEAGLGRGLHVVE